ncbi:MAG: L28 family ribosomal protein [bacterium]|nr:L28 family ribosomal protein [bacterium]
MARQCPLCEKSGVHVWRRVKTISQYNPTAQRKQKPNLQWLTLPSEVTKQAGLPTKSRIRACAKCIKSFGKK